MTTAKGTGPDEPMTDDDPAPRAPRKIVRIRPINRMRQIVRIRMTAMGAMPKRTSFAKFANPSPAHNERLNPRGLR